MKYSFVIWNRVRSQVMTKLIVLTVSGAQKHGVSNPHASVTSTNATKNTMRTSRTMPCPFFYQISSSHSATHETKGVLYKHVRSFCFTTAIKTFPHTDLECRNKKKILQKTRKAGHESFWYSYP